MRTYVITGAASGIGAAAAARLEQDGHRVIRVDIKESDIVVDLSEEEGRAQAIRQILETTSGRLDGVVPCAGLAGLPNRPGSLVVSLNYFGTVSLLAGLREALTQSELPAAVGISSNSTTSTPALSEALVQACLSGDESEACRLADEIGSILAYPTSKMALARWIRRHATTPEWIGSGINLNAIAPGVIDTAMVTEVSQDTVVGPHFENFPLPAGRRGRPEEIAEVIAFLLGPHGRFFVGSMLFCDGGTDALLRPDDWPTPLPS